MDSGAQETYFQKVVERFGRLSRVNEIDTAFASLSLDGASGSGERVAAPWSGQTPVQTERELSTIIQAMRKLREGILASGRLDVFARGVYVFIIRATILAKHMESYHPALLHLLYRIHPATPLATSDLHEFVSYYILDLGCRQADLGAAFAVRYRLGYVDERVEMVLKALLHGDWWLFWRMRDRMDEYQKRLMEWADHRVRKHALNCLGKAYLKVDVEYAEEACNRAWGDLKKVDKVEWELDRHVVMIRRVKR